MKLVAVVFVITSCVIAIDAQFGNSNDFNVEILLSNDRILNNYISCLLDKGPCPREGRQLKQNLPEILRTGCSRCSESDKRNSRRVIMHVMRKNPRAYAQIQQKYDPSGRYAQQYRNYA